MLAFENHVNVENTSTGSREISIDQNFSNIDIECYLNIHKLKKHLKIFVLDMWQWL